MSWSVSYIGTKDKVRAACEASLDTTAKSYEGKEEQKDVLAAKERILAAIDGLNVDEPSATGTTTGIKVDANGSRTDGMYCSIQITVTRVWLLL
jgi:hypothetical protein